MAVQLPPDGSGKVVDTIVVGSNHRQIIVIGDPATSAAQTNVVQYHAQDANKIDTSVYGVLDDSTIQLLDPAYRPDQSSGFFYPQPNIFNRMKSAPGAPGTLATIAVPDPLGSNDSALMRRTMELILLELQTLNAYFLMSGLLNTSAQASETVQTIQA